MKHPLVYFVVNKGDRLAHTKILFLVAYMTCGVFPSFYQSPKNTTKVLSVPALHHLGREA